MFATAEAKLERDIPMPMPPWMIGTLIFNSPILKGFI
jgi:hypothetical protein